MTAHPWTDEDPAPYYGTYCRLNLHVSDPPRELIRRAWRDLKPAAKLADLRESRHAFMRAVLWHHERARELVRRFRL